ncbi:MAG: VWA domain-containing protein, partial [Acidobacteriota bacterium]
AFVGDGDRQYLTGLKLGGERTLVLVDASASMFSTDVGTLDGTDTRQNRFRLAQRVARSVFDGLPDSRFSVVTYSGVASLDLPMTADRNLVRDVLSQIEIHNQYRTTGSSFQRALDAAVSRATADPAADLQVVILGDGEIPDDPAYPKEDYDVPLAALTEQGVPIHGVTIGTVGGQDRVIFDFNDVRAKKADKRVLRRYSTRRVDTHVRQMAATTGGTFLVVRTSGEGDRAAAALVEAILERPARRSWIERDAARRDISAVFLGAFGVLFLVDALWIGRRRPRGPGGFDLQRLGDPPKGQRRRRTATAGLGAALLALVSSCGDVSAPLERAHRENEKGIAADAAGTSGLARRHFERSRGFGARSHIPTYNLARSLTRGGRFAEAHRLNQAALELDPNMAFALYNDGVTLYRWGQAEMDPEGCELDRTLDLWRHAAERFTRAAELAVGELLVLSETNRDFAVEAVADLERRAADPPEHCGEAATEENEPDPAGGGGGEGGGGASGGGAPQGAGGSGPGASGSEPTSSEPSGSDPPSSAPPGSVADDGEPPTGGRANSGTPIANRRPSGIPNRAPSRPRPDKGPDKGTEPPPPPPEAGPPGSAAAGPPGENGDDGEAGPGGSGPRPLDAGEHEQIAAALERIRGQAKEPGKYHRRTRAEQFPKREWEDPDPILWW